VALHEQQGSINRFTTKDEVVDAIRTRVLKDSCRSTNNTAKEQGKQKQNDFKHEIENNQNGNQKSTIKRFSDCCHKPGDNFGLKVLDSDSKV